MTCPRCGARTSEAERVCSDCGHRLGGDDPLPFEERPSLSEQLGEQVAGGPRVKWLLALVLVPLIAIPVVFFIVVGWQSRWGDEVARARLAAPGSANAHFHAKASHRYHLVADTAGSYRRTSGFGRGSKRGMNVAYRVRLLQGGRLVHALDCSSSGSNEVRASGVNADTSRAEGHWRELLRCESSSTRPSVELPALPEGDTTLEVEGKIVDPGMVLRMEQMDLAVYEL